MPKTLQALEAIAKHGAKAAAAVAAEAAAAASGSADTSGGGDDGGGGWEGGGGGDGGGEAGGGKVHVFDFERYNVIGFNSMPNQLPLFCDVSPDELSSLQGEQCIWELFKRSGAVTMMAEEIHDACDSATTTVNAVFRGAYGVQPSELPDHQWWKLFCSPHIKPCCWAKKGFLNPGRRQCVGGGRSLHQVRMGYLHACAHARASLHRAHSHWHACAHARTSLHRAHTHQVMIGYLEEFWTGYLEAPRRWAAINTMVAHEHFMLRLPSLDADLAALLLRMAGTALQDTVVILLSDHGTHGIWYTEYEIGATEHQLPFLYVLAPDWLMRERPEWLRALSVNQRRLVTAHELYRTMRVLAAYPETPPAPGLTIFQELPEGRTCREAGIPEVYCACKRDMG